MRLLYLCIAMEACYLGNYFKFYEICQNDSLVLRWVNATRWLIFWREDNEEETRMVSRGLFYIFNWQMFMIVRLLITLISTSFCYDLIKTIQSPFESYKVRLIYIKRTSIAIVVIFMTYVLILQHFNT